MTTLSRYGLPTDVHFCSRCVMSNQRPMSSVEFKHTTAHQHRGLVFDENGLCDACRYAEMKERLVDWDARERELRALLDRHRRSDGRYDVLVPGSGGKDSAYAAHMLKYRYGMNPLTVTWAPHVYTDIGWKNFQDWIHIGGFDNQLFTPNGRVHRLLTRCAFENLLHPFQPFILGQKYLAPRMAMLHDIPLVFFGENEAEYGNPIKDNQKPTRDPKYYAKQSIADVHLGGVSVPDLIAKHGVTLNELDAYLPPDQAAIERAGVQVHYLGYYLRWTPQESYYYAVEHTGFVANPERTEGTYTKFASLDDRIDGLHYYTTFIKFGIGRATYDAAKDIRNRHITREEGVALVRRFDGEFPAKYYAEMLDYMGIDDARFHELIDAARPEHLWTRTPAGDWALRHQVS